MISRKVNIDVRGDQQVLMLSGEDSNKPVLLFLHGGPGMSNMPITKFVHEGVYSDCNVVDWDQRGTGNSGKLFKSNKDLTIEDFVQDALVVIDWICSHYAKDKILLVGHSWGTILGIKLCELIPQKIIHFIAISPIFCPRIIEKRVEEEFCKLYKFRFSINNSGNLSFYRLLIQRFLLARKGKVLFGKKSLGPIIFHGVFLGSENLTDLVFGFLKMQRVMTGLWKEIQELNIHNEIITKKSLISIVSGEHDAFKDIYQIQYFENNGVKTKLVPKCSHFFHFSNRKEYHELINKSLNN